MKSSDILIVDDEIGIRNLLSEILQDEGYGVAVAQNAEEARALRQETRPAMVLLDIWMPDCDGITLLKEWANNGLLNMPVIMMSGHANIDAAVEATKIGALDFLEKPISLQKLLAAVQHALRYSSMQETSTLSLEKLGKSESIKQLTENLNAAGKTPNNIIMLSGEPGSPFKIVAEYFKSKNKPWIAPNKEQWLKPTQDYIKAAHNGVLYLGNIADYSLEVQAAILSTISRRERYNVRIICACSRPLTDLSTHSDFDHRLGEELSGIVISIPPLRTQLEDIVDLINRVMVSLVESKQIKLVRFSTSALNILRQYDWPGNFDQLNQVIKNIALSSTDKNGSISAEQVSYVLDQYKNRYCKENSDFDFELPLRELRQRVEKRYFEYHIFKENGNMSKVAQKVGLERTHLYRKLKQLEIYTPKFEK